MDFSLLSSVFRVEGRNSDTWNFAQVRYTEPFYNSVIVGDWA